MQKSEKWAKKPAMSVASKKSIVPPKSEATQKPPAPSPKVAKNSPAVSKQTKEEQKEQKDALKNQLYQNQESDSSSSNSNSDAESDSEEDNMQDILDKYEKDLNKSVVSKQSKNLPGQQKIFAEQAMKK